ncbi:MAG TPA: hypothetical protein VL961_06195 [Acidimicrobiales bacterium]|nr:hypothetical protein [Acidimicrobiales bacterium]
MRAPLRATVLRALPLPALVAAAVVTGPLRAGAAQDASVASVLSEVKAAVHRQTGVHVSFAVTSKSLERSERIVADVGSSSGSETVTAGSWSLQVKLTPTHGYVKGNSSGLTSLFGMSSTQAKRAGTKWVVWKKGSSQYKNLETDVTFAAVVDLLPKAKGTHLSTQTVNGVAEDVLTWVTPATDSIPKLNNTLTVTASSSLPVLEVSTGSEGTKASESLSSWGEKVSVPVPPSRDTLASSRLGS